MGVTLTAIRQDGIRAHHKGSQGPAQDFSVTEAMPPITVYTYAKCSTCRKATRWLAAHGIQFEERPIRETPPSLPELRTMLAAYGGQVKRILNTSSQDYRDQNLPARLPAMTETELFALLGRQGNLVKRPFLLGPGVALAGFDEAAWAKALPQAS